jgi:beta-glucosidase
MSSKNRRRWRPVRGAVVLSLVVTALAAPAAAAQPDADCPWVGSTAPVADRVAQVLAQMTEDQKISLLHGNGSSSPYIGNLTGIPDLCIPNLNLQDGPAGVGDGLGGVTQLPAPVALAATFDTASATQYGQVAGAEFAGKGVNVALGPTVNIVRDPRWGRAFETYSEDPYLTSRMAVADVQGLQSQGVMAQVKHAAVYNQETNRNGPDDNAIIDDKTLQEIYLPAFQAAVTDGDAASVMCAYSTVNGTYACQNPYLLNTALYQQAGFDGFVTSDWGATHSTAESADAGMTMEMPNGYFYADFLKQAVDDGTVSESTLDTMVGRVLTKMFEFGLFDKAPSGSTDAIVTTPEHQAAARDIAERGTVLLKNDGNVLPLSTSDTQSIAVIGADGGAGVQTIGGGSATVTSSGTVSPLDGIKARAGSGVDVEYSDGSDVTQAANLAAGSDVAIVFANYGEQEGTDLTSIDLPGNQNDLISSVAAANPKTIVVLNTGSAVTMPWLSNVAGVLEGWYSGQEVGDAIAAILFGDVDPSGKLPVTFPKSLSDVPASTTAQWPGSNGTVQYSEGVDVGYRWYDAKDIAPLFPFGFGLSYTSFGYGDLSVGAADGSGNRTVTATVTNTGSRAGTDVAQLYVGDPASTGEPPKQLRGFQRVTLDPGASTTVSFTLTAHDLAHWDDASSGWTTSAGDYQVYVGDSSRDLPLSTSVSVS